MSPPSVLRSFASQVFRAKRASLLRPWPVATQLTAFAWAALTLPSDLNLQSAMLPVAALVSTVFAISIGRDRMRGWLHAGLGLAAATLFVVDLGAWLRLASAIVVAHATVMSISRWRGVARRWSIVCRDAVLGAGIAVAPAVGVAVAAWFSGSLGSFGLAMAVAMPPAPAAYFTTDAFILLAVMLACDGVREHANRESILGTGLGLAAMALTIVRAAWVISVASFPLEVSWSEAPALVNALKLDAGELLYGPPEYLDSYTYSPLLDLLHHAVLSPFHLELSLHSHRAMVLLEQVAAVAILVSALGPKLARAGWGWIWSACVMLLLAFSGMLAPAVHPDHLVLVAFALAIALLVAESSWPRALWWVVLLGLAPFAAAAKLTGGSIGVGLALAFAAEKRWRPLLVSAVSCVLAAATLPLFDSTLGSYLFYAVDVQRAHRIDWEKLVHLPSTPHGLVALGAAASILCLSRLKSPNAAERNFDVQRVSLLTAVCAFLSLPAWLKYAGRDNNLALLAIGSTCAGLLGMSRHVSRDGATLHPWLGPALALLGLSLLVPPARADGALREAARRDADVMEQVLREDAAAGRTTLQPLSVASWIACGRRAVPRDRYQSAIELAFAGLRQADALISHIEDGRYDTIVMSGRYLRAEATPVGRFNARLRAAIESRYRLAGPPGAMSIDAYPNALVFRLR